MLPSPTTFRKRPLPSAEDAPVGARLSLENAQRHLRAAKTLAGKKLIGPANGHLVLATEELAKACMLVYTILGVELPDGMLRDVMTRHDARHAVILGDAFISVIAHVMDRVMVRVQRRHGVSDFPVALREEYVAELLREIKDFPKRTPRTEPVLAVMEWLTGGSERKNSGFYVDFKDSTWFHPGTAPVRQFKIGYEITRGLVQDRGKFIRRVLAGARLHPITVETVSDRIAGELNLPITTETFERVAEHIYTPLPGSPQAQIRQMNGGNIMRTNETDALLNRLEDVVARYGGEGVAIQEIAVDARRDSEYQSICQQLEGLGVSMGQIETHLFGHRITKEPHVARLRRKR